MAKNEYANMTLLGKGGLLIAAIAAGTFFLVSSASKKENKEATAMAYVASAYETAATSTPSVDSMKNTILSNIYSSALNPNAVLTNLEAIKSEVNTYTSKLTMLAAERTAGRISALTLANYLQSLAQEVMTKLTIEFYPTGGSSGGFPPIGGGGGYNPYGGYGGYGMDAYTQYLQYLQQQQRAQQQYAAQYQQYGYPNYGYSYGYGYQQPQVYSQSPLQTYNYYPQYAAGGYPQSSVTNMYGSGGYGQYGGYGGTSGYGGYY
jgi:hypothetical protein